MRVSDRGLNQLGPAKSKGHWRPTGAQRHRPITASSITSRVAIGTSRRKRYGSSRPITLATIKLAD